MVCSGGVVGLTTAAALTAAEANLMSTEYKRKAVEQLDTFDLVDAIITRPTLTLEKSTHNTPLPQGPPAERGGEPGGSGLERTLPSLRMGVGEGGNVCCGIGYLIMLIMVGSG